MFNIICETLREAGSLGILPSHLTTQPLSPDVRLIDLGIDSLGAMTLLSELSGRLSTPLPDFDIGPHTTLSEIADCMRDAVPSIFTHAT